MTHEKEQISGETDSESEPWYYKPAPQNNEACGKPLARGTVAISPHHSLLHGRPSYDPMEDLDVNVALWRVFMNATLKAAVHLRNDHDVNLRYGKNYSWRTTGQLFGDMEKLSSGQTETTGFNLIDSQDLSRVSTSFISTPLPRSTSFPTRCCAWGKSWKNKIQWYSESNYFSELNRIDGKPMELEWKILLGFKTAGILKEIQKKGGRITV